MARIVFIHGIGKQLLGPETVFADAELGRSIRDGMSIAGLDAKDMAPDDSIQVAFFGDLFRSGTKGYDDPPYQLTDINEGLEADLLRAWLTAGLAQEGDDEATKAGWAPQPVQSLARALLRIPFFARITDRMLVGALKQVSAYLTEAPVRAKVRARLSSRILADTRLVIAHSMGSIVAYEVLCQAELPVMPALITVGSPLGMRGLVFERLDPAPDGGKGCWPRSAARWTNIADIHDIVALEKRLGPFFGERVEDVMIDNECLAHDVRPYLTAADTGRAVFEALSAR